MQAVERGQQLIERENTQNPCPIRGSALGKCPRETALLLDGAQPRELSARSLRIFEMGRERGEGIADAIDAGVEALGWRAFPEVAVWVPIPGVKDPEAVEQAFLARYGKDLPLKVVDGLLAIRSRCDVVLSQRSLKSTTEAHLVEVKTAHSFKIKKLAEEGVDEGYRAQVLLQMAGLELKGIRVLSATVLYEDKADCSLHPVAVERDDRFLNAKLSALANVLNAWQDGSLSAIGHQMDDLISAKTGKLPWQCDYCSVGPLQGNCLPFRQLAPKKSGDMVKWFATRSEF
jgi:hypothetical protein